MPKISALPVATALAASDSFAIVQSGVTKQITAANLLKSVYPIGSIFIAVVSTNPATLLGFGTWVAFAAGRVLVGLGSAPFNTVEATGGEAAHTLTIPEIPSHVHVQAITTNPTIGTEGSLGSDGPSDEGFVGDTAPTGGGGSHNNLQPYIVVYMWKRTA